MSPVGSGIVGCVTSVKWILSGEIAYAKVSIMSRNVNPLGRGVLASLFDFEFKSPVAPKLARYAYALVVGLAALSSLMWFISLVDWLGGTGFVLGLIIAPLSFLVVIMFWRIFLEFVVHVLWIHENTSRILERMDAPVPPPPTAD